MKQVPCLGEVPNPAQGIYQCVIGLNIGFAMELLHSEKRERGFVCQALFSQEFYQTRDGRSGDEVVVAVCFFFEEIPEGFGRVPSGEHARHLAASGFVVGEAEAGFDPAEELEGFAESEVGPVRVPVSSGAQEEDAVVVELAVFVVEVALSQ